MDNPSARFPGLFVLSAALAGWAMKARKRSRALSFLVIGIIAVTAILTCPPPRSVVRLQKGKPQIAKIQIKELEGALQLFRLDTGRYPTTDEGLGVLVRNPGLATWRGPYVSKTELPNDPWGHAYVVEGGGEDITTWEIPPRGR